MNPSLRDICVYVAGSYSAPTPEGVAANVERAIVHYNAVLNTGLNAYLPHFSHYAHQRQERGYEEWMAIDMPWVRRCEILFRTPGASTGADREVTEARLLEHPVVFSVAEAVTVAEQLVLNGLRRNAVHDPRTCRVCQETREQNERAKNKRKAGT